MYLGDVWRESSPLCGVNTTVNQFRLSPRLSVTLITELRFFEELNFNEIRTCGEDGLTRNTQCSQLKHVDLG